ncbi:MAG: ATP-binding protein [Bacteroidota bacterium]
MIGILGARGTGKTTLMLQRLKLHFAGSEEALYVSLDRLVLLNESVYELADLFYKHGGKFLFLDEVHKYPKWAIELKSIYDDFPSLHVVFSGSSALLLQQAKSDLSRRASIYHLHNLSFREFIEFKTGDKFQPVTLRQIVDDHSRQTFAVNQKMRVLKLFTEYLKAGTYPYYFENPSLFYDRLLATVKTIIESDLMALSSFSYSSIVAMQKILALLAESVPFKPNISELSRKSGVARDILLRMIDLLVRADLLIMLRQDSSPTGYLTKPEKLYLHNTALSWAISVNHEPETGTLRETFFLNQLSCRHHVTLPKNGDFLVDNKYTFEVGGVNKSKSQVIDTPNSFVVQDNIESGTGNIIPLWLFGFIY